MKKHIYEIDFIRTICCIGIVIYHFACHTASELSILRSTVNTDVGRNIIVTVFFMISGFALYHNNQEIRSLKTFYWKRIKSIFPSFWLCWLIFYVINVVKVRTPFYAGNPLKLLLTFIGQDGYFQQRIVNYYTVGEWFLGALIFVYAIYPLLLKGYKKNKLLTLLILSGLVTLVYTLNIPVIAPGFPGISESCLKLYLGILIYDQIDNLNNIVVISSIVYIVLYTIIRIPFLNIVFDIICSICWFTVLFKFGTILMNNKTINKVCVFIAGISYQIYLLQHQIILYLLDFHNSVNILPSILSIILSIVFAIIFAYIFKKIIDSLTKSAIFRRIDNVMLK